ncbi:hypothetical protein O3P69_019077 [Scylla paramamosain]|uniref:Uncharacterized protein n=1 Tax=Scylla paramamosain TaxID=85552 RepID=A0AAW0TAP7_SCYPA
MKQVRTRVGHGPLSRLHHQHLPRLQCQLPTRFQCQLLARLQCQLLARLQCQLPAFFRPNSHPIFRPNSRPVLRANFPACLQAQTEREFQETQPQKRRKKADQKDVLDLLLKQIASKEEASREFTHYAKAEYNQSGASGPQAPPLDPVDMKVEELLGEKNATVIGVIQNDLGFHTLRKLQTQQRQEDTEKLGEEPPQQQCANCERWQHRKCNTGISYKDYRSMVKGELHMHWICITCSEVDDLLETEEGGVLEEVGSIPDISTRPALPEEYEESIPPDDIIDEVPGAPPTLLLCRHAANSCLLGGKVKDLRRAVTLTVLLMP